MTASDNRALGRIGEEAALDLLRRRGHRLVARNERIGRGEIDIVTEANGVLHFVEVKTSLYRKGSAFSPEMRINRHKRRSMIEAARRYVFQANVSRETGWQLDVASIRLGEDMVVKSAELYEAVLGDEW